MASYDADAAHDADLDRRDKYRDDPPVEHEPETVRCWTCPAEVNAEEAFQVGRRSYCRSCAIVEAAKVVARHLDDYFSPTEAQVRESELAHGVLEELVETVGDVLKKERRKFDAAALRAIHLRRSL